MKFIFVTMKHESKPVCINPERIECMMELPEGCRITFPYLDRSGDICVMDVEETIAKVLAQIPS